MTKIRQVYRCPICGNVVEVLHSGAVLSCCGQPMQLMEENATDGAYEKHVPVIEPIEGGFRVSYPQRPGGSCRLPGPWSRSSGRARRCR